MISFILILLVSSQVALGQYFGAFSSDPRYRSSAGMAAQLKNLTKTWVAGNNTLPPAAYKTGVNYDRLAQTRLPPAILVDLEDLELPEMFDARQKWPECSSLHTIRNQGCCGSCWAVSAASAMTDRYCTVSKGKAEFTFASTDLMACCRVCGDGCQGGQLGPAWEYWVDKGLPSGGPFQSERGCHPYPIDVCDAAGHEADTPKCSKKCRKGYNVTNVYEDRRYGRVAYSIPADEQKLMEEIYINGPVQAAFVVFEDFHAYKSGVYRHVLGHVVGGHAIKLLGWGVENGVKYWLGANSWGKDWGLNGFFKIARGENQCGIEQNVHAGLPSYQKHMEYEGIYY